MSRKKLSQSTLQDRFNGKYMAIPECGCWIWIGAIDNAGYGRIHGDDGQGNVLAHRVSWVLHNGPIPEGSHVLHRCDTPPCVNPYHLFLGKDMENVQDCIAKKRNAYGERNGHAILSEEQVVEIVKDKRTLRAISKAYGVSFITIFDIKARKTWKSIRRDNEFRSIKSKSRDIR